MLLWILARKYLVTNNYFLLLFINVKIFKTCILGSKSYDEEVKKTEPTPKCTETKKQNCNPFATLKAKLCSAHLPKTSYLTRIAVNKSIGLLSESKNKKSYESNEKKFADESNVSRSQDCDDNTVIMRKCILGSECKSEKHSPKKHQKSCKRNSFSKSTGFLLEEQKRVCKGKSRFLQFQNRY